jgi:hypothetical protein
MISIIRGIEAFGTFSGFSWIKSSCR